MTNSTINVGPNGVTSFNGFDATNLYRAAMVKQGIKLHRDTGMILTRGATITKLFAMATGYTGKKYKRGQHNAAIADMEAWIDAAKASITYTSN